jgi:hypothetical protein
MSNQDAVMVYTVIGVYDDNGQPYCDHYNAGDPTEAARIALMDVESGDLRILCVIAGQHEDVLPMSDGYDLEWASTYAAPKF